MATMTLKSQNDSVTLNVTSEDSASKFDKVTVTLSDLGVTTLVDGDEVNYEEFDTIREARAFFKQTVAEYRQADKDNRAYHREAAENVLTQAAEEFDAGTAERQACRELARLFKAGNAAAALAALKAAGLA